MRRRRWGWRREFIKLFAAQHAITVCIELVKQFIIRWRRWRRLVPLVAVISLLTLLTLLALLTLLPLLRWRRRAMISITLPSRRWRRSIWSTALPLLSRPLVRALPMSLSLILAGTLPLLAILLLRRWRRWRILVVILVLVLVLILILAAVVLGLLIVLGRRRPVRVHEFIARHDTVFVGIESLKELIGT
jgi:hypothetical protein